MAHATRHAQQRLPVRRVPGPDQPQFQRAPLLPPPVAPHGHIQLRHSEPHDRVPSQRALRTGRRRGTPSILRIYLREPNIDNKSGFLDRLRLNTIRSVAVVRLLL